MKTNTKYTALEILQLAKVPEAEKQIGTVRVRIAGITGINSPDHIVTIGKGVEVVDIVVGTEQYSVAVEGEEKELSVSEGAKVSLEAKGKVATKKAEAIQKTKSAQG